MINTLLSLKKLFEMNIWMKSVARGWRHASSQSAPSISWTDYFAIRTSKKRWERAGGLLGGLAGLSGGGYYFLAVADFDPTEPLLGLPDPTIAYVLGALAVGGTSAALGIVGMGAFWRLSKQSYVFFFLDMDRHILALIDQKEKEFFKRLSQHRPKELRFLAVPGSGEVALPDYYGEKIHSISDYRSWIRKQRKFIARNVKSRV